VLHHTEEESNLSTVDTGHKENKSSGYESMEQPSVEGLDERDNASVTPTVFSSSSDNDEETDTIPILPPPLSHSTPARQLSDIPEIESPNALPPTTTAPTSTENMPASVMDQNESSSASNIIFYGTTIAVAGALIYNKLNC